MEVGRGMQIAWLGLGAMGSRMALRLLAAGHDVVVWNRTTARTPALVEAGARLAASPRDAVREAHVVCSMLRDDDASRAVWTDPQEGALAAMERGAIAIEHGTLSPQWVESLARLASTRGVALVHAPVVGSRPQAEAGALQVVIGGDAADVDAVRAVLAALAGGVHHVGDVRAAAAMKLAINTIFAAQVAALAELLPGVERWGVDPSRAMEVIGGLPVASPAARGAGAMIVAGARAPMFPIELVVKDLELAQRAFDQAPLTTAVGGIYRAARDAGRGQQNVHALHVDLLPVRAGR